jgi:hypothetical protein
MRASNDVRRYEAVADTFASVCTCTHCRVHCTSFATHQNGEVARQCVQVQTLANVSATAS